MRRQDELIALYPSCDVLNRKFILSQAESLALTFDSEELLQFLQVEVESDDPVIRHQALFTLARFLPGYIKKRYALSEQAVGLWSEFGRFRREDRSAGSVDPGPKRERRRAASVHLARGMVGQLGQLLHSGEPGVARLARLALAQFPAPEVRELLKAEAERNPGDFEAVLACALAGEGTGALLRIIHENAVSEPDLLMLLDLCPARAAVGTMMDLMDQVGVHGRINMALALGRMIEVDHIEVIRKLLTFREAWVVVFCLRALEARGDPAFLPAIRSIHARTTVETVKVQAVRAAGGLPGQASVVFCLDALRDPSPRVQAQALESLVRLKCAVEVLREEARALLSSSSLRARVNALLAAATPEEEPPAALAALLGSSETIDRVEAAYCLGYIQNPRSLQYLGRMVNTDPSLAVRLQAVKSLSKYEAQDALEFLLPLVGHAEPRIATTAARVLGRFEGAAAVAVCRAIAIRLTQPHRGAERGLLYRTLGAVGGKSCCAEAEAPLRKGLEENDARALAGAVEGWSLYLGQNSSSHGDYLLGALARCDVRSRPRAVMGLILGGQLEGFGQMCQLLSGPAESQLGVMETVLELSLLLSEVVEESKFPVLSAKLDAVAATLDTPVPAAVPRDVCSPATTTDGDFTIHKMKRRPRPAPERVPPAPLVHTTGLGGRLRELTYLIGDSIAEPVFWKKINQTRYIWAPAVLSAVVGLFTLWALVGRIEASKVTLPQGALLVAGFFGRVSYQPTGKPLQARQIVDERARLSVAERARVQLITTKGTTVQFQSPTVSVVRARSDARGYEFEVSRGYCAVSGNPKGDRAQLDYDHYRISTQHGKFTLETYRGKFSVLVERGPVWFTDGVTSLVELDGGDSKVLE